MSFIYFFNLYLSHITSYYTIATIIRITLPKIIMNLYCFVMVSAAHFDHEVDSPQIFPVCGNIIPSCGITGM